MADEPNLPPQTVISAAQAPIIYFDTVSVFGTNIGRDIVTLTLTAGVSILDANDQVQVSQRVVTYLRCNRVAAAQLQESLGKALFMEAPKEGDTKN